MPCACQLFSCTNVGRLRTGFQKLTSLGYHGKLTSRCSQELLGFVNTDKEFNIKKLKNKKPQTRLGPAKQIYCQTFTALKHLLRVSPLDPEAGTAYHVFQLLHDTFYDFRLVFQQLRGKLFIHPSLRDKAKTEHCSPWSKITL